MKGDAGSPSALDPLAALVEHVMRIGIFGNMDHPLF